MASNNVIVFGPTGNIGSVAAITAHEKGAKVWLAMRDPSKPIRGLSKEAEAAGNYERIQADMTKTDSITNAIAKSQAQSAFFYVAHAMPDHMRSSIQALKDAGVKFLVFLSSYTIDRDIHSVEQSDIIPWYHAQVEIPLEEIYGPFDYVAVRPGAFATNVLRWNKSINDGLLEVQCPGAKFDYITPTDMGRVSGSILAAGKQRDGEKHVYVFGTESMSQEKAAKTVARVLGKELTVERASEEATVAMFKREGLPEPLIKYMCAKYEQMGDTDNGVSARPEFKLGQASTKKYSGYEPTSFEAWASANKDIFQV